MLIYLIFFYIKKGEKKCQYICVVVTPQGGGSGYSETLLWTNPDPTTTFYQRNVTLSESFVGFNYIKVIAARSTSKPNAIIETIISNGLLAGAALWFGSDAGVIRNFQYYSNQIISISEGYYFGGSTDNNGCIPIEIYGVNIS